MTSPGPTTAQLLADYLAAAADRRCTLATFLRQTLKGKAASYTSKYLVRLEAAIAKGVEDGEIKEITSRMGGKAYIANDR